jgi:hypothetical protein
MYISAWEIYTGSLRNILKSAVGREEIKSSDIVWRGPSGDAVVTGDAADLSQDDDDAPDYSDYVDSGQVNEYLND